MIAAYILYASFVILVVAITYVALSGRRVDKHGEPFL